MATEGFPNIISPQVALVHAETRTGIVLKVDACSRYLGVGERYMVFPSFAAAKNYALHKVIMDPEVECWIVGADGKSIEGVRPAWTSRKDS